MSIHWGTDVCGEPAPWDDRMACGLDPGHGGDHVLGWMEVLQDTSARWKQEVPK